LKMMEKMGWKQGDGLGVKRQGMTAPVQAKRNIDNRGMELIYLV